MKLPKDKMCFSPLFIQTRARSVLGGKEKRCARMRAQAGNQLAIFCYLEQIFGSIVRLDPKDILSLGVVFRDLYLALSQLDGNLFVGIWMLKLNLNRVSYIALLMF